MSVVIDTGVLYAHHDRDAGRHEAAKDALTEILRGVRGQPYVTDYIYDEAVTLTRYRMGSYEEARTVSDRILETDALRLVRVSHEVFDDAVGIFEKYDDQPLSFTDATTVAVTEKHGIDAVLSFDDDFDGVVERLTPDAL